MPAATGFRGTTQQYTKWDVDSFRPQEGISVFVLNNFLCRTWLRDVQLELGRLIFCRVMAGRADSKITFRSARLRR